MPRVDGQVHAGIGLAAADLDTFEREQVAVWTQLQVVADMHCGWEKTQVDCKFFAQSLDPL